MTAPQETPTNTPAGMEPITADNELAGAGFIEAFGELASMDASDALGVAFNVIGAASAAVMFAVDPLGSLFAAGVGWLMEHVSFLRDALNQLMGDPDAIQANQKEGTDLAVEMRQLAEDHRKAMVNPEGWNGESAEAFSARMEVMGEELDMLAASVETKAKIVAMGGTVVIVLRDIVRDLIAQLIGSLIAYALIAVAMMVPTFGASIPAFITAATAKAITLGVNIASRIARMLKGLAKMMARTDDINVATKRIGKGWEGFEGVADAGEISYEVYKAQRDVEEKTDEVKGKDDAQYDPSRLDQARDKDANYDIKDDGFDDVYLGGFGEDKPQTGGDKPNVHI
jgi:uncharacterized protein YukE